MTAEIVPFPQIRRRCFILRHARYFAGCRQPEKYLQGQLCVQLETMLRRGIRRDLAERECRELSLAIRATAHRLRSWKPEDVA